MSSTIKILDKLTAQSIAAGEVVERPSSVVKELLENSLDAQASRISISIENGGKRLVKVVDNGKGMSKEDALMAFKDHATSKISDINDLNYISSLGFRGEALPSIAAVSKIKLETRRAEDEKGTQLIIEAGKVLKVNEIYTNVGTSLEVRDLFFNTPARFKFLNTDRGETNKITDMIQELALAWPEVSFYYESQGKELIHTPGDNQLISTIYALFGQKFAKGMREIKPISNENGLKISGYIGLPEISRKSRRWQFYYVNKRSIQSPILLRATEDAYKSTLMTQKFPACVLKLDMPSNLVDVNVHPRKLEVRFWNDQAVYKAVYHAVKNTLFTELKPANLDLDEEETTEEQSEATDVEISETTETPETNKELTSSAEEEKPSAQEKLDAARDESLSKPEYEQPKLHLDFSSLGRLNTVSDQSKTYQEKADKTKETKEVPPEPEQLSLSGKEDLDEDARKRLEFKEARYVGELFLTYQLFEYEDKVIIVDQHAAHEKILFEEAVAEFNKNKSISAQYLVKPQRMQIRPQDVNLINEYADLLKAYGFDVDLIGPEEVVIRSIPISREIVAPEESLRFILDDLEENGSSNLKGNRETIYHVLATSACKAAVKAHDPLKKEEVYALREQLLNLENPFHCPHGRPIILIVTKYEIEKLFKRVV